MTKQFHICGTCGKNCLGSVFKFVAFKAVVFIQLAFWLIPLISRNQSTSVYVTATVDLYTKEVAASGGGAINSLQYPSILGGSTVFDTIYSTYNSTGIMAIGVALLAAGGIFALRALPDPETLNTRLEHLTNLIKSKPFPPLPKVNLPISKGYIRLPKLHQYPKLTYNRDYHENGGGEVGTYHGILSFGPPVLPPITSNNYNSLDQSVNPFIRGNGNRYLFPLPPSSIAPTTIPSVGYTNFDPHNVFDPATTTRSAPPTRPTKSKTKNSGRGFGSDLNLGLSPGPPYYRDYELEDYLKLKLKGKNNKNVNAPTKKFSPHNAQIYRNIAALTAKTRQAIKQARQKVKGGFKTLTEDIPKRLNKGLRKTFDTRRSMMPEDDLDGDYYYDSEDGITGPTGMDSKYNDDLPDDVYDYYDEKRLNKYLNEPFYVTENVVVFPKSKPKVPKSPVKRVMQKTKNINYDYNYDYVNGNYPRRLPKNPKERNKDTFDLSKFYK